MPIMTETMKKHFSLAGLFEQVPVVLSNSDGEKAAARLTSFVDGFTFEMDEPFSVPECSIVDVLRRDSGEEMMRFQFLSGGAVKVGDMMTVPAEIELCGNIRPVKSELILLKGDGENPDILVI